MNGPSHDQPVEPNEAAPQRPRPTRSRAPLYVLAAAVVLGVLVGFWLARRGTTLFPTQGAPMGRPTIVVSAPGSPSPPVATTSPMPSVSPVAEEPVAEEYTVESGDTMRLIAEKVYGDAEQWPRIYANNRDVIGPNPDTLHPGTRLRIPPP